MDTLKAKIEKATAPRMKENYDGEMEEKRSGTIRVTPKELDTLVRMRKVKFVMVASGISAFEGETDNYFASYGSIAASKKIVKKLVSDFTRGAETYENRDDVDEEIMAEVYVSAWRDDQLYISIRGN